MPNWKKHLVFGFFFVLVVLLINAFYGFIGIPMTVPFILLAIALIAYFSILPDIDLPNGKVRVVTTILLLIIIGMFVLAGKRIAALVYIVILIVIWVLPAFKGWGHRGKTHSIGFALIMSLIVLIFLSWQLALIAFLAIMSHNIADGEIKLWG